MAYYQLNFAMMHHHKYSLSEIENMIPYEKRIYTELLKQHIESENRRIEELKSNQGKL